MFSTTHFLPIALIALVTMITTASAGTNAFDAQASQFFTSHCTACHGEEKQKGDVTLHDLTADFESAETGRRWLIVLSQLENGEMPPEDEPQPSHEQRARMVADIIEQFRLAGNPIERLRSAPKYGNYVNHDELFSGEHKGPAFSPPRIWRISPYIDGQSSPFSLSQEEGFKDCGKVWRAAKRKNSTTTLRPSKRCKSNGRGFSPWATKSRLAHQRSTNATPR